jgi:hypothetical protein
MCSILHDFICDTSEEEIFLERKEGQLFIGYITKQSFIKLYIFSAKSSAEMPVFSDRVLIN